MSSAQLPCPVCAVPLVMSERQGVEIDYCPQCRGVWLDRGELDKILERSTRDMAPPPPPQQAQTYGQAKPASLRPQLSEAAQVVPGRAVRLMLERRRLPPPPQLACQLAEGASITFGAPLSAAAALRPFAGAAIFSGISSEPVSTATSPSSDFPSSPSSFMSPSMIGACAR